MTGPYLIVPGEMPLAADPRRTDERTVDTLVCLQLDDAFMQAYRATFTEVPADHLRPVGGGVGGFTSVGAPTVNGSGR